MQFGIGPEHRAGLFQHVDAVNRIAIHEDHQIVRLNPVAVHRPQDHANRHPLARLVLTQKHQIGVYVLRVGADKIGDDLFVIRRPRADIERGRNPLAADLTDDGANHPAGDCGLFIIGGHLYVQHPWPPALTPNPVCPPPHAGPFGACKDLGAHGMGEPPAKPPDAQRAQHKGDVEQFGIEKVVGPKDQCP